MSSLKIKQRGQLTLANMPADIDLASAAEIGERLAIEMDHQAQTLVLDLSSTSYVDSAGLDMLLRLSALLRQRRRDLALIVPLDSPLRRFFQIVTLPPTLQVHPDLDTAIEELT